MKKFVWIALLAAISFSFSPAYAARAKLSQPTKKGATKVEKGKKKNKAAEKGKKSVARKGKGSKRSLRRAPAILGTPPKLPIEQPLPPDVLEALSKGDVVHAARGLLMEPPTEKSLYLLREAQRIGEDRDGVKIPKDETHRHYLNVGVANHNLFLFMKREGKTKTGYIKGALTAYAKARKSAPATEKTEVDLLTAALLASSGDNKTGEKKFRKLAKIDFTKDFRGASFIATYYAAQNDAAHAADALKRAYELNPNSTKSWLRVSDDFWQIKGDDELVRLMEEWQIFAQEKQPSKKR